MNALTSMQLSSLEVTKLTVLMGFVAITLKIILPSLRTWVQLSHIPLVPASETAILHRLIFGHMRFLGPMEPPIRTSNNIRNLVDHGEDLCRYHFYLRESRVMLLSVQACLHVMVGRSSRNYVKPRITRAMLTEIVGSKGVLLVEGAEHDRQRRILKPLFEHQSILGCAEVFRHCAENMVNVWLRNSGGFDKYGWKEIDVHDGVAATTLAVIAKVFLGANIEDSKLHQNYRKFLDGHNLSHLAILLYFILPPKYVKYFPLKEIQNERDLLRRIRTELLSITRWHRTEKKDNIGKLPQCYLDSLLSARDLERDGAERESFNDEEIVDQILTFITAGQVTTASCLSWAFFQLAVNPKYQRKVNQELEEHFGYRSLVHSRWLEELDQLPILDSVLRECLRRYPAVNITAREAVADDVICGHKIPSGTIVSIPMMAIHRSTTLWGNDADSFRPERFLNYNEKAKKNSSQWMPFLYGSRSCIGSRLAMLEMKSILAVAFSKCEFEISPGCEPDLMGVILVPKGLQLKIRKRVSYRDKCALL